ncbi:MAG: hypothetical protein SVY10_09060 [Thermodesulfobacteriota bacterium]|nr:hypothetical protein [Thermodesulfobacteriota bacterium]
MNEENKRPEKEVFPPLVGGIEGGGNRLYDKNRNTFTIQPFSPPPHLPHQGGGVCED